MLNKLLLSLSLWLALSFPGPFSPRTVPVGTVVPQVVFRFAGAEEDRWFTSEKIPADVLARMKGRSLPSDSPEIAGDLRYLRILYCNFDGRNQVGEIVCNKAVSDELLEIFHELYRERYPLESVRLVDDFDADDEKSMAANNTSCFNYRVVDGSRTLSKHALGMAVDINPLYNPCVRGRKVLPEAGRPYVDRNAEFQHKITSQDLCCRLFKKYGWRWGGDWRSSKDYQHFDRR